SSLLDGVLRDSNYKFLDNIETAQKETLSDDVTAAFKNAVVQLKIVEANGKLPWAKYKGTHVTHLTKLAPFSRVNLPIGGGSHSINATRDDHGPSWRMVVSLTAQTEAYGIYPGGQSGNPGSKFYDNFIDQWVAGKYYPLWMMKAGEEIDARVKWTIRFNNN
ncbi:MAG: penicillin acylase family protein, partial [Ferruginibacter sp.]|nr:penicillin acylase family protein [Ferruginibacter sp.]